MADNRQPSVLRSLDIVDEGIKTLWVPDEDALKKCEAYGKAFAETVK